MAPFTPFTPLYHYNPLYHYYITILSTVNPHQKSPSSLWWFLPALTKIGTSQWISFSDLGPWCISRNLSMGVAATNSHGSFPRFFTWGKILTYHHLSPSITYGFYCWPGDPVAALAFPRFPLRRHPEAHGSVRSPSAPPRPVASALAGWRHPRGCPPCRRRRRGCGPRPGSWWENHHKWWENMGKSWDFQWTNLQERRIAMENREFFSKSSVISGNFPWPCEFSGEKPTNLWGDIVGKFHWNSITNKYQQYPKDSVWECRVYCQSMANCKTMANCKRESDDKTIIFLAVVQTCSNKAISPTYDNFKLGRLCKLRMKLQIL